MIGNAVPPLLSFYLANELRIAFNLNLIKISKSNWNLPYVEEKSKLNTLSTLLK